MISVYGNVPLVRGLLFQTFGICYKTEYIWA